MSRCALLLGLALFSAPVLAKAKKKRPPKKPPVKKAPPKKADPKKDPKKGETAGEKDAHKLLAAREAKMGPRFPGRDPAFLVLPRSGDRSQMVKELLTPEVKKMTERALAYLASTQDPDGGWSDSQFHSNTGVTALVCMAFMAEGSRARLGKYGQQINRGIEYLLKNVQEGSGIFKGTYSYGPMYEHAYSTLCMIMALGDLPWQGRRPRDVVSRAIQKIAQAQHLDGGWRYQFGRQGHSDMSLTANVLWVLRTAKKSGFTVSATTVKKGVKFVRKCAMPDGTFRYRYFGLHASPSLGGTGIIALANSGKLDHPLIPPARDRIEYDYKRYTVQDLSERRYFVYGAFYASLAMYMCGDRYYLPWYKKASRVLLKIQRKDGEFADRWKNSVYTTAMATILLQSPRGYLSIYER